MPALAASLNTPAISFQHQPFKGLLREGKIVRFPGGRETEYAVPGIRTVTLQDLVTWAQDQIDPHLRREGGRRQKVGESRAIEHLTPAQWRLISAIAGKIAAYIGREGDTREDALRRVGLEHLIWDESGGDGAQGDWARFLELARRASEAKHGPASRNVDNDVGAARTLLDLAATQGWIARTARHADDFAAVPGEWAPQYEQWQAVLRARNIQSNKLVVLELFGACCALSVTPDTAAWLEVAVYLEARWKANGTPGHIRKRVRAGYRHLRREGVVSGPEWMRGLQAPTTLVAIQHIDTVAEAYGSNTNLPWAPPKAQVWAGWKADAQGLIEGTYGLRRFLEYQTAPDDLTLESLDLPPRGIFPRQSIRTQNPRRARAPWRAGSLSMNVKRLMYYAGWLAHERGIDFSKAGHDLRVLLDPENLRAFRDAALRDECTSIWQLYWIISTLARIASPYLEAVAHQEGNEDLADRMAQVGRMLDSAGTPNQGRPSWKTSLLPRMEDKDEIVRRQAKRTEAALTQGGRLAKSAYEMFVRIRDALIDLAIQEAGGLDLDAQIAAVREGRCFGREWARRIQEAQLVQDQLVAPLRSRTIRLMTMEMRHSNGAHPWEGRIYAEYPKEILKAGRAFGPEYITAEDNQPGSSVYTVYDARVYGLYLMPGGGRDILLTDEHGRKQKSSAFYVPDVVASESELDPEDARLSASAYPALRMRILRVTRHATGLPTVAVLTKQGGLRNHAFRHAFGSFHAPKNLLFAAEYLQHADTNTTRRHYCAMDASNLGGARAAAAALRL